MKVPDLFPQVSASRDVLLGLMAIGACGLLLFVLLASRHDRQKAQTEAATTTIAGTVNHAQAAVVKDVAKQSEDTHVVITKVVGRTQRAVARFHAASVSVTIPGVAPADPDRAWYVGMCESPLYANAAECRGYSGGLPHGDASARP